MSASNAEPSTQQAPSSSPSSGGHSHSPPPRRRRAPSGFLRYLMKLTVAGLVVFGSFVYLVQKGCMEGKNLVAGIAEAFTPEMITESFVQWHELEVKGTEGNILEVATAKATEEFTRKTKLKLGFEWPFTEEVSEINVPATYRYHIDINNSWFVTTDGKRVMVLSPRIEPSLPVAFDSGSMQRKTTSGWMRWQWARGEDRELDILQSTITAELAVRASAPETISKVQDEARLAVAKFVRSWLLSQAHWNDRTFTEIAVVFENELTGENPKTLSEQPATLRVGEDAPQTIQVEESKVIP